MKKLLFRKQELFLILISAVVFTMQSCKKESTAESTTLSGAVTRYVSQSVNLDTGLICYLKFSRNLKDSSGRGNDGTAQNGSFTYVRDRHGNPKGAVVFADSRYIEVPEKDIAGLTNATIALDFYVNAISQTVLASKMSWSAVAGSPDFYQSFELSCRSDASFSFHLRQKDYCSSTTTGWNPELLSPSSAIQINTWNHVAVTFNKTVQKLYINGVLVDTDVDTISPICQGEPIRLGVWWLQDPQYFNGYMDEFRFYKRALNATEVKQLSKL